MEFSIATLTRIKEIFPEVSCLPCWEGTVGSFLSVHTNDTSIEPWQLEELQSLPVSILYIKATMAGSIKIAIRPGVRSASDKKTQTI